MAKRRMICATCGSSDVVVDAWASWDIPSQQWELKDIFDDAMCLTCEQACSIDEPELTPDEAADYDTGILEFETMKVLSVDNMPFPKGEPVPCCSACDDVCSDCQNPNMETK